MAVSKFNPLGSILDEMTKRDLVDAVALKTERAKADVETVLDSVLEVIVGALHANERVDLRGFGSFTVKARSARQGRNPRTGEALTIAAKRDASFKASHELSKALTDGLTPPEAGSPA
jgi:nucleoid DNA-binding protein